MTRITDWEKKGLRWDPDLHRFLPLVEIAEPDLAAPALVLLPSAEHEGFDPVAWDPINHVYADITSQANGIFSAPVTAPALVGALATKTAAYTATASDGTFLCNATTAAFNVTLPAASATPAGREYSLVKIDSSVNAVGFSPNGTDTINGANSAVTVATQHNWLSVICDGVSAWHRMDGGIA